MSARILVVEDDPNILLSVQFLLQNAGYTVQTAADGLQAWAALQADPPQLVVLDVMLPVLDGFELCKRIRAHAVCHRTRVLILSARGGEAEMEKSRQLGTDAHLRKPFATRDLLETVARLLVV
ncbi:MAG: response regulator [Betaproteobacteria bacterium]|nr:response regulator [Betaproteobacteria bacterium]